jgi:eukaryotic-like serine/threonine-protein kinase
MVRAVQPNRGVGISATVTLANQDAPAASAQPQAASWDARRGRARAHGTDAERTAIGTRPPGHDRARRAKRPSSRIGTRIDGYQVIKRLAGGGTSVVYLARHAGRASFYALKVLRRQFAADPDMVARFVQEAVLLTRVPHPGLSRFIDRGRTADGAPYMVMEILRGMTVTQRLEMGPMRVPDILDIARQLVDAMTAVHAAGIVHCDLKPDNLFLAPDPLRASRYRVVVIDFGVATVRALGAAGAGGRRPFRRLIGTPSYMAPEQCHVDGSLDPRTDVYGSGCLLYEMLCGQAPFRGSIAEILAAQQNLPPPRAQALRSDTPAALDSLVATMMAKDPDLRPSTMAAVRARLTDAMVLHRG